jgi:hypothetical protein
MTRIGSRGANQERIDEVAARIGAYLDQHGAQFEVDVRLSERDFGINARALEKSAVKATAPVVDALGRSGARARSPQEHCGAA